MEIKKKLQKENGEIMLVFIGAIIVLIMIWLVATEGIRIINIYDDIRTEIERAENITIEYSMNDEARSYTFSEIDEKTAKKQFYDCFTEKLELTNEYQKIDTRTGRIIYQVDFDKLEYDEERARMSSQGGICIYLLFLREYVDIPVEIPFTINVDNTRLVD